jgi:tetratricopeptide (TPR) repeat protein
LQRTGLPADLLSSLAATDEEEQRARLLQIEPALQNPLVVEALCDQAARWLRKDPVRAHKTARTALWLATTINDLPSQGLAHRTLANIFASLSRTPEAYEEYKAALEIFLGLRNDLQAAITRSSALPIVTETDGADAALEWASKARAIFHDTGDQLRLARLENNLAVLLFRQEDYERALERWQAAHETLQQIGETSDQAATLRNLAVCSISLNRPVQAQDYYERARQLCTAHGFTFVLHEIDYNIAYLHYLQGDHHQALRLYQEARNRSRDLGDSYHEALCSLDESEVYIELNLLQEAATVSELAATQFKDQQRPYETAKALYNLALVRSRQGNPRAALEHLESASDQLSGQGNILWPGQIELLRAAVFSSEGRFFEAMRSAGLASTRFRESRLVLREAQARLLLSKARHSQGSYEEAERLCRSSLAALEGFGDPDALFQAFFVLGRVLDSLGDTAAATAAFHRAEQHLMELRERRTASRLRVSIVEQPLDVYSHLITLLLGDESVSELSPDVFRCIETAKARSFADSMVLPGAHGHSRTSMRSQLVDQVSNLRKELTWLYRRIDRSELPDRSSQPSLVETLRTQSREKESELAAKLALLRVRNPESDVDPERIGISSIGDVQNLLRDRALVEYYIAHDLVIAIVVSAGHRKVLPVAIASTVQDLQRRLWHYLHHPTQTGRRARGAAPLDRILAELYRELLLPIQDYIEGSPLIIVPHGFLFLLPFQAFRLENEYLIEHTSLSYIPAAAVLPRVAGMDTTLAGQLGVLRESQALTAGSFFLDEAAEPSGRVFGAETSRQNSDGERASEFVALHLLASAKLRGDNALFSTVTFGGVEHTFLDLHRSKFLCPMISIEGRGFSPTLPSGDREISALWSALLTTGARSASIPSDFGSTETHREHARLLCNELTRGHEVADAHRNATLALISRGATVREWSCLFLVGDPFLKLFSTPPTASLQ